MDAVAGERSREEKKVTKRKLANEDRPDTVERADKANRPKKAKMEDRLDTAESLRDEVKSASEVQKSVRALEKPERYQKSEKAEKLEKVEPVSRRGPCAAAAALDADGAVGDGVGDSCSSYSVGRSSSYSSCDRAGRSQSERRRRQREREGLRGASGFSAPLAPPPPPPPPGVSEARPPGLGGVTYGPVPAEGLAMVPLPEKVRGLLDNQETLAQEVAR